MELSKTLLITKDHINEYIKESVNLHSKFNGYFLHYYKSKQIVFACLDNVKGQIKKRLLKRSILIEYETSKIYNKEKKANLNFYLLKYETKSNLLSVKFLFKKYNINERETRHDKLMNILKSNNV